MSEPLLIGTYGWNYDAWQGGFYADDLPSDWRFCYYSNAIRSVLVPGALWETGEAEPGQWMEDSDPEFRFVLELPPALARPGAGDLSAGVNAFAERAAPLAARTAAWMLRVDAHSAPHAAWLAEICAAAGEHAPLCVDLPAGAWRDGAPADIVRDGDTALCWHPGESLAPAEGGRFLVAMLGDADLKALRWVVETLGQWMGEARGAALFFEHLGSAPRLAEQARILAELLEV
jgi:hypothetical protein